MPITEVKLERIRTDFGPDCGTNPRSVLRGLDSHIPDFQPNNEDLPKMENTPKNEVGIHWLRGSFSQDNLDDFAEFMELFFGEFETKDFGRYFYDRSYNWPGGASLNFHAHPDRCEKLTAGKVCFDIPGAALDMLGDIELAAFVWGFKLLKFNVSCTRLDVYFDDDIRTITPHELLTIAQAGDYAGFRRHGSGQEFKRRRGGCKFEKDMIYFGSRGNAGSGAYLRVYDKGLESEGENNAVRWELELSGKKAQAVFQKLTECESRKHEFAAICGAVIGGSIDFLHKTDKNLSRCKRHDFWQSILCRIGAAKLRLEYGRTKLEKAKEWVQNQVAPTLTAIKQALKPEDFYDLLLNLAECKTRLKPKHWDMIRDYRNEVERRERFDMTVIRDFFNQHEIDFGYDMENQNA